MEVPLLLFVKSQSGGSVRGGYMYNFPALEAFDGAGRLVYRSHDGGKNAVFLRALPQSLAQVSAIQGQPDLGASLRVLPQLSERNRRTLVDNHLPALIAFTLDQCDACTVQENALTPDRARAIAARGFNIMIVRVTP